MRMLSALRRDGDIWLFTAYAIALTAVVLIPPIAGPCFAPWPELPAISVFRGICALLLAAVLPGYVLLRAFHRPRDLSAEEELLIAITISMFLTPLVFISAFRLGLDAEGIYWTLVGVYSSVLAAGIVLKYVLRRGEGQPTDIKRFRWRESIPLWIFLGFITALSMSIDIANYHLLKGDEWGHHGTALMLTRGLFPMNPEKRVAFYPWWFHAYMASLFTLSGLPSVNTYVLARIMHFVFWLAFYCMVKELAKGVGNPERMALIATILLVTGGYGGFYAFYLMSKAESLDALTLYWIGNISVSLTEMASPGFIVVYGPATHGFACMFTLLFLSIKHIRSLRAKAILCALAFASGFLFYVAEAILAVAAIGLIALSMRRERLGVLEGALVGIPLGALIIAAIDFIAPGMFYLVSLPVVINVGHLYLCLMVYSVSLFIFFAKRKVVMRKHISLSVPKPVSMAAKAVLLCGLIYVYMLGFIVWDIMKNPPYRTTIYMIHHHQWVPWWMFPMRFGVMGTLLSLIHI